MIRTWNGRVSLPKNNQAIIDNFVSGRRTTLSHKSPNEFIECCSTTNRIFVSLGDRSILELREIKDGSFEIFRRWTTDDQCKWRSDLDSSDDFAVTTCVITELDSSSRFGLTIIDQKDSKAKIVTDSSVLFACTEKYLFVREENDHLTRIDLDSEEIRTLDDFLSPTVVVCDLKCGFAHIVILDSHGCVHTCGFGLRGELGLGDLESREKPVLVEALVGVRIRKIAVGGWHTVAITEFGDAYVWGWNSDGQLGYGKETTSSIVEPRHLEIPDDVSVVSAACGSRHSVFLLENGDVYGCGWNAYNQLGESDGEMVPLGKLNFSSDRKNNLDVVDIDAKGWSTILYCKI